MRIKITIELSEKRFPADYRRAFLHLMKNALSTYMNGIYFQDFFPEGRPQRKEYAFAVGLPQGSACRGEYFDLGKNGMSLRSRQGILPIIFFYIMHSAV